MSLRQTQSIPLYRRQEQKVHVKFVVNEDPGLRTLYYQIITAELPTIKKESDFINPRKKEFSMAWKQSIEY